MEGQTWIMYRSLYFPRLANQPGLLIHADGVADFTLYSVNEGFGKEFKFCLRNKDSIEYCKKANDRKPIRKKTIHTT